MPGLVPGIHVLLSSSTKDVDGRDKPGHDGGRSEAEPAPAGTEMQPTGARNGCHCFRIVIYNDFCNRNVSARIEPANSHHGDVVEWHHAAGCAVV
jgi:hypothetical protein